MRAARTAASSAFSGEKKQKNASLHRRLSARETEIFFGDAQREPRSRPKRTPRSASFHTHAQPVHGIAACALPDAFFEQKDGERVSVASFAVATAGWDGDAQVHVFTDFEDADFSEKTKHRDAVTKHRRVDLCATHTLRGHAAGLYACAFSSPASPTFLGTASGDGSARLWDASSLWRENLSETFGDSDDGDVPPSSVFLKRKEKKQKTVFPCVACLRGNDGEVNGVAFDTEKFFDSNNETTAPATLATSTDSGAVVFWDVASATRVAAAVGHADAAYGACFFGREQNALVASVSFDKTCKAWDRRARANTESGGVACVATLTGHEDDVVGVDVCSSSASPFVLATGSDDGTVRLWDTRSWRCLEVLEAPHAGAQVKRVRFSPDGAALVTAGGDGLAKTFPLRAGKKKKRLRGRFAFFTFKKRRRGDDAARARRRRLRRRVGPVGPEPRRASDRHRGTRRGVARLGPRGRGLSVA